jgi:hypothetical protein
MHMTTSKETGTPVVSQCQVPLRFACVSHLSRVCGESICQESIHVIVRGAVTTGQEVVEGWKQAELGRTLQKRGSASALDHLPRAFGPYASNNHPELLLYVWIVLTP